MLGGEPSLIAAPPAGHLGKAHKKLGRKEEITPPSFSKETVCITGEPISKPAKIKS
ncbi:MAG: hypothetical protein ACETVN_02890 [Asgard group archaeon]